MLHTLTSPPSFILVNRDSDSRQQQHMKTAHLLCVLWAAMTALPLATHAAKIHAPSTGAAPASPSVAPAGPLKLHVPSPHWRDQIIYFVVTDRFNDGDAGNNDFATGEYDPTSNAKYNGGDLAGVMQKLDYIRNLGATAIWLTPPVANQWWDPTAQFSGFHGYWAENFMKVDRHLGTLEDYKRLSHAIHSAGMYLVQDIVVNHTGNFFSYDGAWNNPDPAGNFKINTESRPATAPSQWPFSLNDARDPKHRRAHIYHWTPNVSDFTNPTQEKNFQMSGLDDLNTENKAVRNALKESHGYWIKEVGVDAFRIDTAFYVPTDFYTDFLYSQDAKHPGIFLVAQQTGRKNFHVFGEGFAIDKPFDNKQTKKIERYMNAPNGHVLMPGMLNFPLYGTMGDIFARGRPTAELAYRISSMMKDYRRPHLMPTFIDNHDVDRFLVGGTLPGLRQSLLMIMTLPGIPVIYYGTEQAFTEQRGAMFKAGFQSGGRDRFDTEAPMYRFIAEVSTLRRANKLFSRGIPKILKANPAGPGAIVYQMSSGKDAAIVAFNSSAADVLVDNINTGLPAGAVLKAMFGIDGLPRDLVIGVNGRISFRLAAHAGLVWKVTKNKTTVPTMTGAITLNPLPDNIVRGDLRLSGTAQGIDTFKLLVDGNLSTAQVIKPQRNGLWNATINTDNMLDPAVRHNVVAWAEGSALGRDLLSTSQNFRVTRNWVKLAAVKDPANDDHGPRGQYLYPTNQTWRGKRQMDIQQVRVSTTGGSLRIGITMNKVTTSWNPPNGFDHVAFTLFIGIPDRDGGTTVMPLQNATLPSGMRWHYRLRANGWSNSLFSADGASSTNEGTPVGPAADIDVDQKKNWVTFTLRANAFGKLSSLSGVKLYLTTWDYDSGYRALTPTATDSTIGGGNHATDPLVMDDTVVITLP